MTEPGPRQPATPLRHHLPNLVTLLGLGAGLTALRFVYSGAFEVAAVLIVAAAVLDGLDGLLARRLNCSSAFGAELDSLADFLNFGVAPAFLVHRYALGDAGGVAWIAALGFAVCCCLRLARFNASRGAPAPGPPHFVGVPAPAGALLAMLPVFLSFAGLVDAAAHPGAVAAHVAFVGGLMVSRLRTPSPKALRLPRDKLGWLALAIAAVVGLALTRFWLLMALVDAVYLAVLLRSAAVAARARV